MSDLLTARHGATGVITLNRPARRNALRMDGWRALAGAVRAFGDDPDVRAIVLRGAGEEAFSAGADLEEFAALRGEPQGAADYHAAFADALAAIGAVGQPVIAMIHGHCVGGGCALAVACDLRLADERARFAIPATRLGVILGPDQLRALHDLVGGAATRDILLAGRTLGAAEALRVGLVNEVVPAADLHDAALALAGRIAGYAPVALAATKDLLARLARGESDADLAAAHAAHSRRAFASPDYNAAARAFNAARDRRGSNPAPPPPPATEA